MSGGRIALLVIGIVLLVGGLVIMACGGGMMWVSQVIKDNSGFITTRTTHLQRDSYAIITEPFDMEWDAGSPWNPGDFVTFKVEAKSNNSKGIFIGIARESDVTGYLSNVRYDVIKQWVSHRFDDGEIQYETHSGPSAPSVPTDQTFWESSVHGGGTQTLEWTPKAGKWVVVIMNEDGAAGINVSGTVGARVPWLFWVGLGFLLAGVTVLVGGIVMVYFAARSPHPPVSTTQTLAQ